MTGGDKITARFMRRDFFDFVPKFKLFITGNHKPRLHNVDEAIRRRMLLVPFTVQIPPEERDQDLPQKLKAEWPAILRWMFDGCLEWRCELCACRRRDMHATCVIITSYSRQLDTTRIIDPLHWRIFGSSRCRKGRF